MFLYYIKTIKKFFYLAKKIKRQKKTPEGVFLNLIQIMLKQY